MCASFISFSITRHTLVTKITVLPNSKGILTQAKFTVHKNVKKTMRYTVTHLKVALCQCTKGSGANVLFMDYRYHVLCVRVPKNADNWGF